MAFIQKQSVPLSFTAGLQSKTDDLQLQSPALLGLENACFNKIGQLNKRFGYDILNTDVMGGQTILSASAIDLFNNELTLFDNKNVYTYISSKDTWANRGPAISLINENKQIVRTSDAQQLNPECVTTSGIEVYVWEDSRGGCRYSVIDTNTNAYIISDKEIEGAAARPKLVLFNNLIYVFYTDNINLNYRTINPNNPNTISVQTTFVSYLHPDGVYDLAVYNSNNITNGDQEYLYIFYQISFNGNVSVDLDVRDTSMASVYSTSIETSTTAISDITKSTVNVCITSGTIAWFVWSSGAKVYFANYDASDLTSVNLITATSIIDNDNYSKYITSIETIAPGNLQVAYEVTASQTYNEYVKTVTISSPLGTPTYTLLNTIKSVGLASKCFKYDDNIYVHLAHQSTLQSTYFTAQLNNYPFNIIDKVSSQVGGGLRTNRMLGQVSSLSTGIFIWANLIKGQFISESNTNFSLLGVNSTKLDFTNNNKFNSVTQSNNLLFVGGILQSYDGISVVEQNFHLYPENVTTSTHSTGGSLSVGQYQYQVVYAWSDKFGQIQYSAPSPTITVSNNSITGSITLTVPTLRITSKSNVVIKIYRTAVNGSLFNEVTSELAPLLNDKTTDTVTFLDTASDTAIAANQLIYTTGGVLPNSAPPSCSLISLYKDRVMVSGLEDPNSIWFSKNKFNNSNFNTIPVEFSNQLTIAVSQTGGPITALGLMDDKLIIFKKNSIFVLIGDGPNDLGGGDQFPSPELVTNSIGCNNANSVILTKDGIIFQSEKGLWLLDRGLGAPQYIGAGVDNEAKDHLISSATLDPNDNLIIFTTFDGPTLVYDYYIQQWSTYTNHIATDSVAFDGVFTYVKPNGKVYKQNRNKYTDGDSFISMSLTTPWLSFAGMQGYQRAFRAFILGRFKSPHTLLVEVAYDFNPTFLQSATINATTVSGANQWGSDPTWGSSSPWGGTYLPYEFQINLQRQTCTSLRLRISDDQTAEDYNEGYTISSLVLEAGVLPDPNRLPVTNKVGTS